MIAGLAGNVFSAVKGDVVTVVLHCRPSLWCGVIWFQKSNIVWKKRNYELLTPCNVRIINLGWIKQITLSWRWRYLTQSSCFIKKTRKWRKYITDNFRQKCRGAGSRSHEYRGIFSRSIDGTSRYFRVSGWWSSRFFPTLELSSVLTLRWSLSSPSTQQREKSSCHLWTWKQRYERVRTLEVINHRLWSLIWKPTTT